MEMTSGDVVQATLVLVLVLVTGYYAFYTHRMANLLQEQIIEGRTQRARDLKADARGAVLSWLAEVRALVANPPDWAAEDAMADWTLNRQGPVFGRGFRALASVVEAGLPWAMELLGIQSALTSLVKELSDVMDGRPDGAALKSSVKDILDRVGKLEITVLKSADPSVGTDEAADTTVGGTQV